MNGIKQIPGLVRELCSLVDKLESLFPGRRFTLDGHLVGSLGEVLAADLYGLELLAASTQGHDARAPDGRLVQVKATQRTAVGLRERPKHLLVLRILPDGDAEEVYNGPGALPWAQAGKLQRNGQRMISLSRLMALMEQVAPEERLARLTT